MGTIIIYYNYILKMRKLRHKTLILQRDTDDKLTILVVVFSTHIPEKKSLNIEV